MSIPNYRIFNSRFSLVHSAKGSTWEDHKYIKRIDGTYYYPDGYEGGRHLPEDEKTDKESDSELNLSKDDIEALANEVIRGNFRNGQTRKDLLGSNYSEIQKRVNELMMSSAGSKKISEVNQESIKAAGDAAKNISKKSNVHSGVDMNQVLSVYRNKR